jgi:hypothetical protein
MGHPGTIFKAAVSCITHLTQQLVTSVQLFLDPGLQPAKKASHGRNWSSLVQQKLVSDYLVQGHTQ